MRNMVAATHRVLVRLTPPKPYLPACLRMGSWGVYGDEVPLMRCGGWVVIEWILRVYLWKELMCWRMVF